MLPTLTWTSSHGSTGTKTAEHGFDDAGPDGCDRQDLGSRLQLDRGFGHSVDHGGGGILGDGEAAGGAEREQTFGTVASHAGQQHPDTEGAMRLRQRRKQRVGGGTVGRVARVRGVVQQAVAVIDQMVGELASQMPLAETWSPSCAMRTGNAL